MLAAIVTAFAAKISALSVFSMVAKGPVAKPEYPMAVVFDTTSDLVDGRPSERRELTLAVQIESYLDGVDPDMDEVRDLVDAVDSCLHGWWMGGKGSEPVMVTKISLVQMETGKPVIYQVLVKVKVHPVQFSLT